MSGAFIAFENLLALTYAASRFLSEFEVWEEIREGKKRTCLVISSCSSEENVLK